MDMIAKSDFASHRIPNTKWHQQQKYTSRYPC